MQPFLTSSKLTMRAAVITKPGSIEVRKVPVPTPKPDELLIRLEGCGVCHSNLPPWEGRPWFNYPLEPGQLGHEGWGMVIEVGSDVSGFERGTRVAFLSNHAYAEFDATPATAAVRLPSFLDALPFPGEPLGCAMNIFGRSHIQAGQTVAIVGIGFLGVLLTQLVVAAGARVIAISRRGFALDLARSAGASHAIAMDDHWKIIRLVKELTEQKLCDVTIEAVGQQWPLDLAAEITRERGRLIIAGYHQDGTRQVNMQLWNWRGLDVINAHEREVAVYAEGMRLAADAVATGRLNPLPLYTHRISLEQLGDAFNLLRKRPDGFVKSLVMFESKN